MKILIVGGAGTIGQYIVDRCKENSDEVITAGRCTGDVNVDMTSTTSIAELFKAVGNIDALVVIAGEAKWAPFQEMSEDDFYIGLKSKLMGQVNLVRYGLDYLNPEGSITLTTGILADDPVLNTTSAAMVNGAIHSFVRALALEIRTIRINAVSLGVVEPAYNNYKDFFPGHNPIPTKRMINAYLKSIYGKDHGRIIKDY